MMKGKQGMINAAKSEMPKRQTSDKPAGKAGRESMVGNETKAEVRATQEGGSMAEAKGTGSSLRMAGDELRRQHPHSYADHGPHHGTTDHIRHEPLHGLKAKGYGR